MKPFLLQTVPFISAEGRERLTTGFEVHPLPREADRPRFLKEYGERYVGLVTAGGFGADAALMDTLPNLRVIASRGVGFDTIDIAHANRRGIAVSNTPDVLSDCVADLAFGAALAIGRRFCEADRFVRRGDWAHGRLPMATRVSGKRLGILGLGAIGRVVAKRAAGFAMPIAYHNRRPVSDVPYRYEESPASLAEWADFLVVTVTGGPETRHLVSRAVLEALGPEGYLVNVSRGSVVDQEALVEMLQTRRIAGAALDVFEKEPHVPAALTALDNVILFPHMSSSTNETFAVMEGLVVDNLRNFFTHGTLVTPVR